jgi:hypothetical protein
VLHLRDNGELQTGWPRRWCVREVAVLAVSIDGELRRGERRGYGAARDVRNIQRRDTELSRGR